MKKLLLALVILVSASVQSMEDPIPLPQDMPNNNGLLGLHNSFLLNNVQQIAINLNIALKENNYSSVLAKLKQEILQQNISISDIKNEENENILHRLPLCNNIKVARLCLQAAGSDTWKLITQKNILGTTPLFRAILTGKIKFVKLYLDAAGERAHDLIYIENCLRKTALDVAAGKPEIKSVMQHYLQQNKQQKSSLY